MARSHTAARKSLAELKELKDAGLDRIHIGLETGYDPLLVYMEKGCTAKNHIEGGKKVKKQAFLCVNMSCLVWGARKCLKNMPGKQPGVKRD